MNSNQNSKTDSLDLDDLLKNINAKSKPQNKSILSYFAVDKQPNDSKDTSLKKVNPEKSNPIIIEKAPESKKTEIHEEKKIEKRQDKYRILPGCKFCEIIHKNTEKIIYEDEICAAFHDKHKINAQEHILMCAKTHINNIHFVEKDNISLLTHLQDAGEALLKRLRPNESYRFGYHEPPMNSVEHLHLHCIVLPITSKFLNQVIYGFKLASTEKVISKIVNGEIHPGNVPEKQKKIKTKK